MLYKVGDKVILNTAQNTNGRQNKVNKWFQSNSKIIIEEVRGTFYEISVDGNRDDFWWNDSMINHEKTINLNNKKENKPMKKEIDLSIKQVIYNPPATILVHNDGTKTVVKTTSNDEYDPIFGYLMAYFQKHSGLSKTQVGKLCDKIVEDFSKQQEKKNKLVLKDGFDEEYC